MKDKKILDFVDIDLFVKCKYCKEDWSQWDYSMDDSESFLSLVEPEIKNHISEEHQLEFAKYLRKVVEKQYGRD
jgi:hypothetical protein